MSRRILMVLGVVVLLALGTFAYARSTGTLIPGLPQTPVTSWLPSSMAPGDSLLLAERAHQRCRLLQGTQRSACYEAILLALVEQGEVRLAMTTLSRLGTLDDFVPRHGHDFTHVVGINAWAPGKDVGAIFDQCTELYQSGCYHGVVQAYLDANGTDSAVVVGLCGLVPSTHTNLWLRFQCVHGLGHGLVQTRSMQLPKALGGCDLLGDSWDRESCYGGAFMEFIVGGRGQSHHPHHSTRASTTVAAASHEDHAAADHAGHEEHQGHGDHAAVPSDSFKVRDRSDPLYPCSVLETRYQRSCYGMQAGIIIETTGADFGKIAAACDQAPPGMRAWCYQGIGTYVSGFTTRNTSKSIELCSLGNPKYRAWCFVGVAKNYIDVTADPEDGIQFCRRINDHAVSVNCYVAVGEELSVLKSNPNDRAAVCAGVDQPYIQACRFGAALEGQPPAELAQRDG